jgi:hypothetical protein
MDMSSTINRHFQQTKDQFYQNSGYCDTRTDKQLLILDSISDVTAPAKAFNKDLHEPLKIDTLSDVYLDNFTTFEGLINTAVDNKAFVLSINELPIKTNSTNPALYNKIVIPNETTTPTKSTSHKSRKMNYICTLNPQTLTKLSGTITDIQGGLSGAAGFRFIAEFIIVARN